VTDTSQRFTGERDHNLPVTFHVPFWLAATHDGKTVAFDQPVENKPRSCWSTTFD